MTVPAIPLVRDANKVTPPHQALRAFRFNLRRIAAKIMPHERVAACGCKAHQSHVDIRNGKHGAFVGGVVTCGSVWSCAVCAAKVAEAKRKDVAAAIEAHQGAGGLVYMAAYTIPHGRLQSAKELRNVVAGTWGKVQAGAPWKRAMGKAGIIGMVRAMEVTYGDHGWHPHLHVLFFAAKGHEPMAAKEFGEWTFRRWANRVDKAGYGICNPAVFRFEATSSTERAGDYVTKWGADRELTQGHVKRAAKGSFTPWDLLNEAGRGSHRARILFREFAAAFKGGRQLTWSRGLRERYGLRDERPDDEIAADIEETAPIIGQLEKHAFRAVIKKRLLAALLDFVESRPVWADILEWLKTRGITNDFRRSAGPRPGKVPGDGGADGQGDAKPDATPRCSRRAGAA